MARKVAVTKPPKKDMATTNHLGPCLNSLVKTRQLGKNSDVRADTLSYHELKDRVTCLMLIVTLNHQKVSFKLTFQKT